MNKALTGMYKWLPLMLVLLVMPCVPLIAQDALDDLLTRENTSAEAEKPSASIDVSTSEGNDDAIESRLQGIYSELDSLGELTVDVTNGIVTLSGAAASRQAAVQVNVIASQVEGVVEVVDELTIDTSLSRRLARTGQRLRDGLQAFVALLPMLLVAALAASLFWWLGIRLSNRSEFFARLAPNGFIAELLSSLARLVVTIAGFILALSLLDATSILGSVLGAAGIVGLAVGFAVRDTVENYIASILLSLRSPFLARDYVSIEGHEGNVARLTSRATILITPDGNHVRIPNSIVYKSVIINYTRNPRRRFEFGVGVDTDIDLSDAQSLALQSVHAVPGVLASPAAVVLVTELGDSNIALTIMAWINQDEHDILKVRSESIRHVKQAFDDAGIVMPEPIYRLRIQGHSGVFSELNTAELSHLPGVDAGLVGPTPTDLSRSDTEPGSMGDRARQQVSDTSADTSTHQALEKEIGAVENENLLGGQSRQE